MSKMNRYDLHDKMIIFTKDLHIPAKYIKTVSIAADSSSATLTITVVVPDVDIAQGMVTIRDNVLQYCADETKKSK